MSLDDVAGCRWMSLDVVAGQQTAEMMLAATPHYSNVSLDALVLL